MGYTTEFRGAFRITPKVDAVLACRLNLWLNSRHFKRTFDVANAEDTTLFGKPGDHGEFVMPSLRKAVQHTIQQGYNPLIAVHMINADDDFRALSDEEMRVYNEMPGDIPSLWSDILIINSTKEDESFLTWNGSEKSRHLDEWIKRVAGFLHQCGYQVEGCIAAQGEDAGDIWSMTFCDGRFDVHRHWMNPTYEKESAAAEQSSREAAKKTIPENIQEMIDTAKYLPKICNSLQDKEDKRC